MISILLILVYSSKSLGFGYDSGSDQGACGKPLRGAREYKPPCDLTHGYCTSAGTTYPWHAVRRFVRENQGLMRRMYGDQRHFMVLQSELEHDANDIHPEFDYFYGNVDKEENAPRLLHDDPKLGEFLNAKFVYSEQSFVAKLSMPHFRQTTEKMSEPEQKSVTVTTDVNTTVYENTTESLGTTEESTETTVESTVTDESTTEHSTATKGVEDVTTESAQKKETAGEVLFQDMEDPPKKNQNQINFKLKGVNACPVKEEVVAPYWANNTRGEVLALLNLYPFEQYVHWEKCTYEHRQMYCREGCRCEQQYRLHRLLAYDPNNECRGIFADWFRFPSCCICKCYNIPPDFRVTSRSPRNKVSENDINDVPAWFLGKNLGVFNEQ